jgi:two-component system, LytTR family, response regulator AlgR
MSEALKVIIVDDELPARNRLKEVLEDCGDKLPVRLLAEASDGIRAVELMNEMAPDVMLLDIRMPGMDGIEVARHAQKLAVPPAVIFTTAFDAYAVKAFELNAIDYLLKPIRRERLLAALQKAAARRGPAAGLEKLQQNARSHLSIGERGKVILVPLTEVLYLRAELKYVTIKTAAREHLLEESLTNLEEEFGNYFVRVHRNCLVARNAIAGFERVTQTDGDAGWVVLLKGLDEKLPVSRRQQYIIREFKGE